MLVYQRVSATTGICTVWSNPGIYPAVGTAGAGCSSPHPPRDKAAMRSSGGNWPSSLGLPGFSCDTSSIFSKKSLEKCDPERNASYIDTLIHIHIYIIIYIYICVCALCDIIKNRG